MSKRPIKGDSCQTGQLSQDVSYCALYLGQNFITRHEISVSVLHEQRNHTSWYFSASLRYLSGDNPCLTK